MIKLLFFLLISDMKTIRIVNTPAWGMQMEHFKILKLSKMDLKISCWEYSFMIHIPEAIFKVL